MRRTKASQERDGNNRYERLARSLRIPKYKQLEEEPPVAETRTLVERVWDAIVRTPYVSEFGANAKFLGMSCGLHRKKLDVILLLLERAGRITTDGDTVRLVK